MANRVAVSLCTVLLGAMCLWTAGCGSEEGQAPPADEELKRPSRLWPDVPPPPEPGQGVTGSLTAPAEPAEGATTEGATTEGATTEGAATEGAATEGAATEGAATEGAAGTGDAPTGGTEGGGAADGGTATEPAPAGGG